MATRHLIVNADDFGQTPGITDGIIRCHVHGIVTSASLMVRWPAAKAAADAAQRHPSLSVGLHLDFGEWIFRDGSWVSLYRVIDASDPTVASQEIDRQLAAFRTLMGRDPTHLDSHQHVHREEPVRSIVVDLGARLRIPVRHLDSRIRYSGQFYGQSGKGDPFPAGITVESALATIASLEEGTTELGCHPASLADVESMYREERIRECETLCDPRLRQAIQEAGIELCSFKNFPGLLTE